MDVFSSTLSCFDSGLTCSVITKHAQATYPFLLCLPTSMSTSKLPTGTMQPMSREAYLEDLEDLFNCHPDPGREVALAIHGYLKGLRHAGILTLSDYSQFSDRLPLNGEDLAEIGVNL